MNYKTLGEKKMELKKTCPFKFSSFLGPKPQVESKILRQSNIPEFAQFNVSPECNLDNCAAGYKDASGKDACSICDAMKAYLKAIRYNDIL